MIYFLIGDSSTEMGKGIAIGIVAFSIIYVIYLFSKRKEIKSDLKRSLHQKELAKIDSEISQIKILRNQSIIDERDFDKKLGALEAHKKSIKVEYYLNQNERYNSLKRALDKGFIDNDQFDLKVEEIRSEITKNVR